MNRRTLVLLTHNYQRSGVLDTSGSTKGLVSPRKIAREKVTHLHWACPCWAIGNVRSMLLLGLPFTCSEARRSLLFWIRLPLGSQWDNMVFHSFLNILQHVFSNVTLICLPLTFFLPITKICCAAQFVTQDATQIFSQKENLLRHGLLWI